MLITEIFFWISIIILFFCYLGYGLLLLLINRARSLFAQHRPIAQPATPLPVTIIIPAFNEGDILEEKIKNTLALDYPDDLLTIIFVTDGSTDDSPGIVQRHRRLTLLHQPQRRGKLAAINRAMGIVTTPVVVFSDANAMLNKECVQRIARHYSDPKTGGVAGEKRISASANESAIGEAEGIYWNYESFMKRQDAEFNTVVGAAGELYSIRTGLFPLLDGQIILDDFVISMKICLKGYKFRYEPGAFATELPSASLMEEEKRKARISAGAYQSIGYLKQALNFFRFPALCFQFISRRLLRWTVCPLLLIVLLLTNVIISTSGRHDKIFDLMLLAQLAFYLFAIFGWFMIRAGSKMALLTIPFYFVFMNYCLVKGLFKFLSGKQTVLWEKSRRQARE